MKEKIINIFHNKFFIIALLFIAILFSFASNCFASYNVTVNDISYTLPDFPSSSLDYFVLFYDPSTNYFCIDYVESPNSVKFRSDNDGIFHVGGSIHTHHFYSPDYPNWGNAISSSDAGTFMQNISVLFCNFDFYNTDGDLVFQQAPAQGEQQGETQGIQALTLEQAEQIPQAMTQTLQVVIPVGLAIFGIGLVIFLVRYLILRLM